MPKQNKHARNRLTERGGVGLVMFHLARLGLEFVVTYDGSAHGDVWVHTRSGKVGLEVKATLRQTAWHISRSQVGRSEFYCLVRLDEGLVYVVPSDVVASLIEKATNVYDGIAILSGRTIPKEYRGAWRLLGVSDLDKPDALDRPQRFPAKWRRHTRRVTRTLASGEVKTYVYPAILT